MALALLTADEKGISVTPQKTASPLGVFASILYFSLP